LPTRRIDHLSDLHFGRTDPAVVPALLRRLNDDPADLVVVSGDLTMRARRREYHEAAEFLAALRSPWLAVPGNHDITAYFPWERFADPYRRWRELLHAEVEPEWRDDAVAVIGLNTVSRGGLRRDWAGGRMHRSRLLRLLQRVRATPPGLFRIVVAHHPFLAPPDAPDTPTLNRAERSLRAFARAGVRLVLAGHLHRGYAADAPLGASLPGEGDAGGSAGLAVGGSGRPGLTVLQAGSATSTRLRGEPNAYHRITVEHGRARWTVCRWDGAAWA